MDSSRGAAHSAILSVLEKAGTIGMHIDDVMKMLGFEEKKQIVPRLYTLQSEGKVERLNGQKWRVMPISGTESDILPLEQIQQDDQTQTPVSTTPKQTSKPTGPKTFISYKNLLQENCQKKHLPVPKYKTERGPEYGYIGTVMFAGTELKSAIPMPSPKEAEQRVAFEALKNSQALPASAEFNVKTEVNNPTKKRKFQTNSSPETAQFSNNPAQIVNKNQGISYKSQLNEFAQKGKYHSPTYSVEKHSEGFIATVYFNDMQFNSMRPLKLKKQAEQSAAYAALAHFGKVSTPFSHTNYPTIDFAPSGDQKPWYAEDGTDDYAPNKKPAGAQPSRPLFPSGTPFGNDSEPTEYPVPFQRPPHPGPFQRPPHPGPFQRPPHPGPFQRPPHQGPFQRPPHLGPFQRPPHLGPFQRPPHPGPIQRPRHPGPRNPGPRHPGPPQNGGASSNKPLCSETPKNKLQEYLQKSKKNLPIYETTQDSIHSPYTFTCIVKFDNVSYTSEVQRNKKAAEQSAARVALLDLGLIGPEE